MALSRYCENLRKVERELAELERGQARLVELGREARRYGRVQMTVGLFRNLGLYRAKVQEFVALLRGAPQDGELHDAVSGLLVVQRFVDESGWLLERMPGEEEHGVVQLTDEQMWAVVSLRKNAQRLEELVVRAIVHQEEIDVS